MLKKFMITACLLSLTLTMGCWSKSELDQMAIVLGVGLDKADAGQVRITVEVAQPRAMGGGSRGGGENVPPALILENEGKTVFEAVRGVINVNSRKLFFSHNQILIMGEGLAKEGLQEVIDFLERDPELRVEVPLIVARDQAQDILNLQGKMESSLALAVHNALKSAERAGIVPNIRFLDFLLKYQSPTTAPVAPYLIIDTTNQQETYKVVGLAVFKKDKMVGRLNEEEARGYLWVQGEINNAVIVVNSPQNNQRPLSIEITNTATEIKPLIKDGKPSFEVSIKTEGNIGEVDTPVDITKPEFIEGLKAQTQKKIERQVKAALSKGQKDFKADIFGFGEKVRTGYKKDWKRLQTTWEEEFPAAPIQLSVEVRIRHAGEKTTPTKPR